MTFDPSALSRLRSLTQLVVSVVLYSLMGFFPCGGAPWRWHWSNPLPHGNDIVDFAYRANQPFIQVTDHGQIYASEDLDQWESRESGTRRDLRGATFFDNRLVVCGERGLILWSDDIQRFQQIDLGTDDWLEAVVASPARAVAVGDNAAIYLSDDGVSWSRQAVPFTNWLHGVAWGGGVFAAVGDGGLVVTSPDGVTWTQRNVAGGNSASLNWIAASGNGFVVAGNRSGEQGTIIFGNASGTSWVRQTQSGSTRDLFTAAAASPFSRLVAGDLEVRLATGASVIRWSDPPAVSNGPPLADYLAATSDGKRYVLGGRTGLTVHSRRASPNLEDAVWSSHPSPPRNWLFDVLAAQSGSTNVTVAIEGDRPVYRSAPMTNRFYVACGDLATLMTSETGVDWTVAVPPPRATNQVYLSMAFNSRGIIASGSDGILSFSPSGYLPITSTNRLTNSVGIIEVTVTNEVSTLGLIWQDVNSLTDLDLLAVSASPRQFVIAGEGGYVATSPDGTNWTQQVSGTTRSITGVEPWQDGFVAIGEDGIVLTSPDGSRWTPQNSGTTNWLFRVRAGPGQLVSVGRNGTIITSLDGIQWTLRESGITNTLNDVVFAVDRWFAVGSLGVVLHSVDGVVWTRDDQIITGKSLFGLATQDSQLIVVGVEGVILRTRVTPYLNPVEILKFPQSPEEQLLIFRGEPDQRFRLDQGSAVNSLQPGPILTIRDPDGLLFYYDPVTNEPSSQFFVAPSEP